MVVPLKDIKPVSNAEVGLAETGSKPSAICRIEGCYKFAWANGLCAMHYQRMRQHGSPEARVKKTCTVEGCDEPHMAKGLCGKHYMRQRNAAKRNPNLAKSMTNDEARALRADIMSYLDDGQARSHREIARAMDIEAKHIIPFQMRQLVSSGRVEVIYVRGEGVRKTPTWRIK